MENKSIVYCWLIHQLLATPVSKDTSDRGNAGKACLSRLCHLCHFSKLGGVEDVLKSLMEITFRKS